MASNITKSCIFYVFLFISMVDRNAYIYLCRKLKNFEILGIISEFLLNTEKELNISVFFFSANLLIALFSNRHLGEFALFEFLLVQFFFFFNQHFKGCKLWLVIQNNLVLSSFIVSFWLKLCINFGRRERKVHSYFFLWVFFFSIRVKP